MSTPQKGASKEKPVSKAPASSGTKDPPKPARRSSTVNSATLLAIGDEVLSGEIANANAAYLSARLSEAGLAVREHVVVSDDAAAIKAALVRLQKETDVIIVTGGLGPTEDDRTIDVVSELLSVEAGPPPASPGAVKKRFSSPGFGMTPHNLRHGRGAQGGPAPPHRAG